MGVTWETDRTSILQMQACPRLRWWSRHYLGRGIQKKGKSLPLLVGSAVHEGLEILLSKSDVEAGVERARVYLEKEFATHGIALDEEQQKVEYSKAEQLALTEALLRAWWAYEGESFHRAFEVLEVEKEGRADMGDGITLLFRPDALVRERESGDLYVVSWKTAASFDKRTIERCKHDMQSMSEVWGIQQEARKIDDEALEGFSIQAPDIHIEGVLYKFLLKGRRELDDYLGHWVQRSHLIQGWVRPGVTEEESEWAWRYRWPSDDPKRKMEQLPKGYRMVSIWDNYPGGVKAWIEALAAGEIIPRNINALEAIFPQSLPVARRGDEVESWRLQVVEQEKRVGFALADVAFAARYGQEKAGLDSRMPQHTARCEDWNGCSYRDVCFNPAIGADPIGSGLYELRIPNHPEKGDVDE